jgi:AraC-like DNA-binding protein
VPSSNVRTFTDPDDYATSIRGTNSEVTVTEPGLFAGKIVQMGLHDLWLQCLSKNLAHVAHTALVPDRTVVSFWTRPVAGLAWNGVDIQSSQIVWHREAEQFYHRASGPTQRATMSLPMDVMASAVSTVAGSDSVPRRQGRLITPRPTAMAKLQRLHAMAGRFAENAPEVIASGEAAHGLKMVLIEAMIDCLTTASSAEGSIACRRHERIMRRFRTFIAEHPEEAIYIPQLCAAIGVPERTLRSCCCKSLGMSPKRYLVLRRMQLARQALRKADAARTTVTAIAANFGFFAFGRFSVQYRALYGEMPCTTLRTPPTVS